jgi:2-C-methyl-D-erythritol 2,4-cyclodiphosphate synthase
LEGRFDDEGKPLTVLGAAVSAFAACAEIKIIVIAVPPGAETGEFAARKALPSRCLYSPGTGGGDGGPLVLFVPGGKNRRASVHHALSLLAAYHPSHVLIHDGARPWVEASLIRRTMAAAARYRAALPVLPLVETPKELEAAPEALPGAGALPAGPGERPGAAAEPGAAGVFFVGRHLRRSHTGTAQTPQGFAFPEILRAHEKAAKRELAEGFEYTDDAEIWGEFCGPVAAVPGSPENRKITFPEDLGGGGNRMTGTTRVGMGRDLHRLVKGRPFLLGGVELVSDQGELGHSDGDVLAHAVTDAVLGAAGLGDIGALFPPSGEAWKDADSMDLLRAAFALVKKSGWRLVNLDCVVSCENPKLLPYREGIRFSLALALESDPGTVFVKGKTGEGLGPVGEGLAVEALAVCLLEKN